MNDQAAHVKSRFLHSFIVDVIFIFILFGTFCPWQGSFGLDVANLRPCVISTATLSLSGKALTSRSHYASSFPITQLFKAPAVWTRRMACVNSMTNVTSLFYLTAWHFVDLYQILSHANKERNLTSEHKHAKLNDDMDYAVITAVENRDGSPCFSSFL